MPLIFKGGNDMTRDKVEIENGNITATGRDIWMTDYEIANMFGIKSRLLNNSIKALLKENPLLEKEGYRYIRLENGNFADAYNLEVIIALAFEFNTYFTSIFRKWVTAKVLAKNSLQTPIFLHLSKGLAN